MSRTAFAIFCVTTALFGVCEGNTAAQCAQFGLNDKYTIWKYGNDGIPKKGYYTIAAKKFDAMWLAAIGSRYGFEGNINGTIKPKKADGSCPWEWPQCKGVPTPYPPGFGCSEEHPRIEPCVPNNEVRMDMYLVKQAGRVLHGWVHVEIELLDQTDEIEIIYIQMRDEAFNAIGEFVTAANYPGATCTPSKDYLATPKHFEFFPCSATGLRESKTSQAIMMANKEYYFEKDDLLAKSYLHEGSIERGVHFLWKFNEYWCSRHQKLQPYAYILTRKNRERFQGILVDGNPTRMLRKVPNYWLHPKWFGAEDIIFKYGAKLECNELAIDDNSGQVTPNAVNSWFQAQSSLMTLDGDNWHGKNRYKILATGNLGSNLCQADPLAPTQTKDTVPVFSGRCKHHFAKDVSRNEFQGCNTDPTSNEFEGVDTSNFQIYDKYLNEKQENRSQFCNLNCTKPTTEQHLKDILAFEAKNDTEEDVAAAIIPGKNDQRTKAKIIKLQAGRKYHGITLGFVAFFITSVSVFVARNYKETYLRKRCYGVHVWYWTHFGGIIATMCLGFSGHSAITPFVKVWGNSLEEYGRLHRICGYSSAGTFGFLVVFGGLRIRAPGAGRVFTMVLHAFMGFAHHWLNLATVMFSTWIPRSPTLAGCDKVKGLPEGYSFVFWIALAWTVVDLIFHIILTVLHIHRDRMIGIWRQGFYFPIVPLVRNEQMTDMEGQKLRKALLYLYILIALAAACASAVSIIYHKMPSHCKYGEMTCKHIFGCTLLAIKYETWYINHGGVLPTDD